MTAPASFSLLAPAYFKKYGLDADKGKEVLARIAWKNHRNGAKNPKAQFRKEVPMETILNSPKVADPLGIMDCSGVSRRLGGGDRRPRRGRAQVHEASDLHQGAVVRRRPGRRPARRRTTTSRPSARSSRRREDAYKQAGITDPREADQHGRGPRLLHADRARALRGPRLQPARHRLAGRDGRLLRSRRARCRSIPTAGSSRSATRSAPRACA